MLVFGGACSCCELVCLLDGALRGFYGLVATWWLRFGVYLVFGRCGI